MNADSTPGTANADFAKGTVNAAARQRMPNLALLIIFQIRYQLQLYLATPGALVIGIGLPVVLLVASDAKHAGKLALPILAGYAVFGLTVTAFATHGVRLVIARESGILRRWRASPLPPWCYFVSQVITTCLFATLTGAATLLVGKLFYGAHVSGTAFGYVLVAMLLGALCWAALSTALTGIIPAVEAAQPTFILVYFPIVILSGALGSAPKLPHWLNTLVSYLPGQPLVGAISSALSGVPGLPSRDVLVLAGWVAAGLIAAILTFRWEPHRRRQRRPARVSP